MIRRRKVPVSLVMAPQEEHRLVNVFILLIAIDRRVNAQQTQTKKAKKINTRKSGSLNSGPILRSTSYVGQALFLYASIAG